MALTGLATHDMDNDAVGAGQPEESISDEQAKTINNLIKASGADPEVFLARVGTETVDTIPAKMFQRSIDWLSKVKAIREKKAEKREPGSDFSGSKRDMIMER